MSPVSKPEKAALLVGIFSGDKEFLERCPPRFSEFGEFALKSPVRDFGFTNYYTHSMGSPLFRRFMLFQPGFPIHDLPQIKTRTIELEKELARLTSLSVERPLNIDPGYLTLSKLVLASTKDHTHRIYLRDGIFAEVTLYYRNNSFRSWPWTYPDYASEKYIGFFNRCRSCLQR